MRVNVSCGSEPALDAEGIITPDYTQGDSGTASQFWNALANTQAEQARNLAEPREGGV